MNSGQILKISADGELEYCKFKYEDYSYISAFRWWEQSFDDKSKNEYLADIKTVASSLGYSPDEVDILYNDGFTLEEIEEFIYC